MRIRIQSSSAAALAVVFAASFHPGVAHADGPRAAYDSGGDADASLDPGEEQMTADEENQARQQDLSDAYHNGYNARAKEDADTYASLRDQLKTERNAAPPPLPSNMPDGDDARVTPVPSPSVAQQPYHRLPPAQQYTMAPAYANASYAPPPAYQQPVIVQQAYAPPPPPPPPPVVQYVPVYAQAEYAPPPPPVYQQPVVTVAAPVWSGYPSGYWNGYGYQRTYGYGVWR